MVMDRSLRSRRRPRLHLSETSSQYGGRKKERSPSPPPEMLLPYLRGGAKRWGGPRRRPWRCFDA